MSGMVTPVNIHSNIIQSIILKPRSALIKYNGQIKTQQSYTAHKLNDRHCIYKYEFKIQVLVFSSNYKIMPELSGGVLII